MTSLSRGDALLSTVARMNRWANRYAQLPAPAAQLRLLSLLDDLGPSRIGDLAQADNSSQPTMTTQVQRLERLGLVGRKSDARDARASLIEITPAGAETLLAAREARRQVVLPLLENITEEEAATLDAAVEIVNRSLKELRAQNPNAILAID